MSLFRYLVFFIVARTILSIHDESIKQAETDLEVEDLDPDPPPEIPADHTDIYHLNVGGEIIATTRQTLMKIPESTFWILFNGDWEDRLSKDQNGNIFFDFNPTLFRHLLDQLQVLEFNSSVQLYPPFQPSLVEPFIRMLRKLGLEQCLSSEKKNVITFNVGGQPITTQRTAFPDVMNSSLDAVVTNSKMMNVDTESDVFIDYDPKLFRYLIQQLRQQLSESISSFRLSSKEEKLAFERTLNDLNIFVDATTTIRIITTTTKSTKRYNNSYHIQTEDDFPLNTRWKPSGVRVAGAKEPGHQLDQLSHPKGIFVDDDDRSIYLADSSNNRVVQWKLGATMGEVVAGGTNQLNNPTDVILDKKTNSLIICDGENRRVVQWSRRKGSVGQTIIPDIDCWGLALDNDGNLYVSDCEKHEVTRRTIGEKDGTVVAGVRGEGNQLDQLNLPTYLFVDEDHSIYVSDCMNHRVMKWVKGATEGIVVAGRQGQGNSLTQLHYPYGVVVDRLGNVLVADCFNHRIMSWSAGSNQGRVVVGGNGPGQQSDQLSNPYGLSLDRQGHLYVVDYGNHRVQKFEADFVSR